MLEWAHELILRFIFLLFSHDFKDSIATVDQCTNQNKVSITKSRFVVVAFYRLYLRIAPTWINFEPIKHSLMFSSCGFKSAAQRYKCTKWNRVLCNWILYAHIHGSIRCIFLHSFNMLSIWSLLLPLTPFERMQFDLWAILFFFSVMIQNRLGSSTLECLTWNAATRIFFSIFSLPSLLFFKRWLILLQSPCCHLIYI